MNQKYMMECSNLPGIVACAVIPLPERLIKSSFITKDEHEADQDQSPTKNWPSSFVTTLFIAVKFY
jgi:hypothetical protein